MRVVTEDMGSDAGLRDNASIEAQTRDLSQLIALGLIEARSRGLEPVVILDRDLSVPLPAADTVVLMRGSPLDQAGHAGRLNPRTLVYLGSAAELRAAITESRIPQCSSALVCEDGTWTYIEMEARTPAHSEPFRTSRMLRLLARHRAVGRLMTTAARSLQGSLRARRLQPYVDNRENAIFAALTRSADFPYRIDRPIEGRVLLAIGHLGGGGAERQIVNTLEGLVDRGVADVHILLINPDGEHGQYSEKAVRLAHAIHHAEYADISGHPWLAGRADWRDLMPADLMNRVFAAARVIAKVRPAVLQTSLDWNNVVVGMAAVLCGVPNIQVSGRNLAPHWFEFFQWFMYPCYRALLRHPSVHMTNNSEAGRDSYARWLKVSRKSIRVLRNGLQDAEFPLASASERGRIRRELSIPDGALVVAGAFRLSAEKRPMLWLEAAAKVRATLPDIRFVLCGAGNMQAEIEARAEALGFGDRLMLLGSRQDVFSIFSAADLVMQSSLQEGTPNTLIEAQAMGLPVVTTRAYGAAEAVDSGRTGIVVTHDTPECLAQATVAILQDVTFREGARSSGPDWVRRRFGFARMIDETLASYADGGAPWACDLLPEPMRHLERLPLTAFVHDGGFCWRARCSSLRRLADSSADPVRSPVLLLEDGVQIGVAHSEHAIIRRSGRGCYSHWRDQVFLSTSDNSDPRQNGKRYELAVPRGVVMKPV